MANNKFIKSFRNSVKEILEEGAYERSGGISADKLVSDEGASFAEEYADLARKVADLVLNYFDIVDLNAPENAQIKRMYANVEKVNDILNYGAEAYNHNTAEK